MANFSQMLEKLNGGNTMARLNEQLTELVKAVAATNKVGTIQLKLKLSPNGDNGITVEEDISTKVPQPSLGKSLFFTDDEGDLLRVDPRQAEMPFARVVSESAVAAG